MERYHFIGIGGDGMSALAKAFWQQRRPLQGSNIEPNTRTRELSRLGIPVALGHDPGHLGTADAVVYSSAIPAHNVEMCEARRRGLPVLHRQQVLAELVAAQRTVGVAGTHGKTTSTVMMATLLQRAGLDPSYLIGAGCAALGGHARCGRGDHLVLEVDESDGRFLDFHPHLALVTSVGLDHLNHYGDHGALLASFDRFIAQSAHAVLCADDAGCRALLERHPRALSYGLSPDADLVAANVTQSDFQTRFSLSFRGRHLGPVALPLPGLHNVYNALGALLAGWRLGLPFSRTLPLLAHFQLPERRFEVVYRNGVVLVDDYAHLPEQVAVNLQTVRANWRRGRVVALFQPHRFSRMHHLGAQFGPAFAQADLVGVTDIYPAFEAPIPGVDGHGVFDQVAAHAGQARYLPGPQEVTDFLERALEPGDFVIAFGAGDLSQLLRGHAQVRRQRNAHDVVHA